MSSSFPGSPDNFTTSLTAGQVHTSARQNDVHDAINKIEAEVLSMERGGLSVLMAAPAGAFATDEASWNAAKALIVTAGGGVIRFRPGTYVVRYAQCTVPDNTRVEIPVGTTVQGGASSAGASAVAMFSPVTAPPTAPQNIHFVIDGVLDGNRRGGNHGAAEGIFGITLTDAENCSVTVNGKVYQFRGEGIYVGHSGAGAGTSPVAKHVRVVGSGTVADCGIKESGDGGNPRMGVAVIAGYDVLVDQLLIDTVGAYAVDFEGNNTDDAMDGCVAGPNLRFRNVAQGNVNMTTPGTFGKGNRVECQDAIAAMPSGTATTTSGSPNLTLVTPTTGWVNGMRVVGSGIPAGTTILSGAGTATMVMSANASASAAGVAIRAYPFGTIYNIPANRARMVRKKRQSTDLTLNSASFADVSNTDFDITLPAQVGDIIRYTPNFLVGGVATFLQFDVATVVAGSPVNYFSSGTGTPNGAGVGSWRVTSTAGTNFPVSGAIEYTLVAADIDDSTVTLRLRYDQNTGTNQTLFASTGVCAAVVFAENLGPGW